MADTRGTRYYVNSEGFTVVAPIQTASLLISADAQAADGMLLRDSYRVTENALQDLPSATDLAARAREIAARLKVERDAPVGEEYTGPVLFEGQAGPELLAQAFVPLLLAQRPPDSDNPRGGQGQGQVTPFLSRIGLRVFAESFSVSDTPSLKQFAGRPVPGAYDVDDEGVRAKDVTLIENGRLVALLIGRTPQRNLLQSNGHGRGNGVQAGVVQVRSTRGIPASDLTKKYLELLRVQDKDFGYIVRGLDTQGFMRIVKVMPDGREEPVRGLRIAGIPQTAFRDILEASEEQTLYTYRAGGNAAVSVIAPSLLFEEIEIQRTRDILQKPPIVPSPLLQSPLL
jgi:predicted Zn-dependent protease